MDGHPVDALVRTLMGRGYKSDLGLVCFDLDGTLYHDDRIYLRMIDYYCRYSMGEGDRVCKGGDEPGAGGRQSGPAAGLPPGMGGVSWPGAGWPRRPTPASGPLPLAGPEMLVLYLRRLEPGHVPGPAYRLGR